MEEGVKKKVLVIASAVIICVALVIFYKSLFGGESSFGGEDFPIWLKCTNPACNAVYSLKNAEMAKLQSQTDSMMLMPGQPQAYTCQKCGKKSAYMALKCENKKCGEVFFQGQAGDVKYPDKCPKCGFSYSENYDKTHKE